MSDQSVSGEVQALKCGYFLGVAMMVCWTNAVADFAGKEASLAFLREAWADWTRWWMWVILWIVVSAAIQVWNRFTIQRAKKVAEP